MTALDSLGTPALRMSQGVDITRIIDLKKRYRFGIVVEDPQSRWSEDPRRYAEIAAKYRELLGNDFMLDLNILSFRTRENPTAFPTLIQTGTEALALVAAATGQVARVVLYAESSVNPQDLPYLSYASASGVDIQRTENTYRISSPSSTALNLGDPQRVITIDGDLHTATSDGRFLIPAGTHLIRTDVSPLRVTSDSLSTTLSSITGNLLSEEETQRGVDFEYISGPRCLVTVKKPPVALMIDGQEAPLQVLEGTGRFSVFLPEGRHQVRITTTSRISYGIDLTSLWSSSLIVAFGLLATSALIVLYLWVGFSRRTRRGRNRGEGKTGT